MVLQLYKHDISLTLFYKLIVFSIKEINCRIKFECYLDAHYI